MAITEILETKVDQAAGAASFLSPDVVQIEQPWPEQTVYTAEQIETADKELKELTSQDGFDRQFTTGSVDFVNGRRDTPSALVFIRHQKLAEVAYRKYDPPLQ